MENLNQCPSCGNSNLNTILRAKDYTVSKEFFDIVKCDSCQFVFTNPRPKANEAGKFYQSENYISHSNTQKGLINKLYHTVRKVTLRQKTNWIEDYKKGNKKLLDIGCGNGHFLHAAKERGWNITGMELDPQTAKKAKDLIQETIHPSISTIPENETFDLISLWHVLEHVYELDDYFTFFKNHLSKSGKLLFALPNHLSYDAQVFQEYWAAYDVPRHIYHFNPKTLENLAIKHGFRLVKSKGQIFDSFYISLLSNEYKYGNKKIFSSFFVGLISNLKAYFKTGNYSSNLYILEHA
jgi:2-polyprenyl-3-methyl-5-hydroxy-6-metoxy-1,4-benzoquinol methylase